MEVSRYHLCIAFIFIHSFLGSRPIPSLEGNQRIHFHYLSEPPAFLKHIPFVLAGPIKVIYQIFDILVALLVHVSDAPEYILVQVR